MGRWPVGHPPFPSLLYEYPVTFVPGPPPCEAPGTCSPIAPGRVWPVASWASVPWYLSTVGVQWIRPYHTLDHTFQVAHQRAGPVSAPPPSPTLPLGPHTASPPAAPRQAVPVPNIR